LIVATPKLARCRAIDAGTKAVAQAALAATAIAALLNFMVAVRLMCSKM
jgi:hypothetical protein